MHGSGTGSANAKTISPALKPDFPGSGCAVQKLRVFVHVFSFLPQVSHVFEHISSHVVSLICSNVAKILHTVLPNG